MRERGIVNVANIAVVDGKILTSAPDFNSVAVADRRVAPEKILRLNRAADPRECAVRDLEILERICADTVRAYIHDGNVVDRDVIVASDSETVTADAELYRLETAAGIFFRSEIQIPAPLRVRLEFRFRRIVVPEMEIAVKIGITFIERPAAVLLAEGSVLDVDGNNLDRVGPSAVENDSPRIIRPDLATPDILCISLFPLRGIGAVKWRWRDARLGSRSVRCIRDAGAGLYAAAE